MKSRFWLRGLAMSLSLAGFSGTSFAQMIPYGQGLAPNSFQPRYVTVSGSPITIGSYPSLAQNTQPVPGHVHVPQGNYTNTEILQSVVPQQLPDSRLMLTQPAAPQAQITPLPPVQSSTPAYMQPTPAAPLTPSASPMYSVPGPTQAAPGMAPSPAPTAAPSSEFYGYDASGSCSTCNTGINYAPSAPVYAPMYMTRAVAPNPWFIGGNALIFNRVDNEYVRLASTVSMPSDYLLNTLNADMRTSGGFEVFGGRYFCCGRYAIMGSYWGLFPTEQSEIIYDPNLDTGSGDSIRSDLDFTMRGPGGAPTSEHGLEMPGGANVPGTNGGQTLYDWYDNSYAQRLIRDQEFHNIEVNFFSFALGGAARGGLVDPCGGGCGHGCGHHGRHGGCGSACGGCASSCGSCNTCVAPCRGPTGPCGPITGAQCSRLRFSMLGGFRWFRFNDYMEYASSETDGSFGYGADDIYYRNEVTNDLVGFQLGGLANYCCGHRISLYGGSKFGAFCNLINYDSYAGTATTPAIVSSYTSYDNQQYIIDSSNNSLALLGEAELGLGICVCRGLTATCGYRVIGVSGIATAPGQIPYDFSLLNDASKIQNDSSLILHGLTIGGMYNW